MSKPTIREWVQHTFAYRGPKMFLEFGANNGSDTRWMAAIPGVTMHAVEVDPRNSPSKPLPPNVTWHKFAIAGHDGTCELILSERRYDKPWTASSSIKKPTGHLELMPEITFFDKTVKVKCLTLDTFAARNSIGVVDLIWSDIQGAEPDMIRGGQKTLSQTKYLYAEVPEAEEYEGQLCLDGILEILPGEWRVVHRWPFDALMENTEFAR